MRKEFLKTSSQELQEVIDGTKPAALGYWENIPDGILKFDLNAVYGRFYDMAIARNKSNLDRVVLAYYAPLSKESDIELGRALGYEEKDISDYVKIMKYPDKLMYLTKEDRTYLKVNAAIQKVGINNVIIETISALNGSQDAKHLIEKEGLDFNYVIEILLKKLKNN